MMVVRVAHERPHDGVATEWFDHGQTLAILPLNGNRAGAVLTLASGAIDALMKLDAAALSAELTRRFQGRLGAMTVIEPSCSVRVTRRVSCSQVISRPSRSRVLPLE